ncbi:MAG: hypothetical protein LJE88_06480 [Deltaproteobacteria bacterium]|nr:hypothetical protein [Deltaproteobacteria bacterium]
MADKLRRHPWKVTSVGDEVDSICSRCKEETIHRVVAMVGENIHLVICTRCNSQHRYRPSLATMREKTPLPSKRQARIIKKLEKTKTSQSHTPLRDWLNLRETLAGENPSKYNPTENYREKQVLAHPSFGLGFVRRVVGASKIEVVFEHEVKILVMNRAKSGQE